MEKPRDSQTLAAPIQDGMLEVARTRAAMVGQHAKQELAYNYLASREFAQRNR
jgi:hypothetical protein